jgi:hypothetical protein
MSFRFVIIIPKILNFLAHSMDLLVILNYISITYL